MTEISNELSVMGVEMEEEDKVVHLLANLPESYNTLFTALEACPQVPRMEVVTEKLKKPSLRTVTRRQSTGYRLEFKSKTPRTKVLLLS
jgi:hypothetical protein